MTRAAREKAKAKEKVAKKEDLLLRKLAEVLRAHSLDRASAPLSDNPYIPAGYTYLGQLIAHDLTFHDLQALPLARTRGVRSFSRSSSLDLDCIYGEGPEASPWFYEREAVSPMPRRRLRLGRVCETDAERDNVLNGRCDNNNVPISPSGPFLDLPRVSVRHLSDDGGQSREFDTVIADPRNEGNLILSQLTVLFCRFHNNVVARLEELEGPPTRQKPIDYYRRQYRQARAATVQCYRRIIREDYLRRLLHPQVYAEFVTGRRRKSFRYVNAGRLEVPDVFWMAAFRVGHAMVRDAYVFPPIAGNGSTSPRSLPPRIARTPSLLNFDGNRGSSHVPITREWLVDWNLFFDMAPAPGTSADGAGALRSVPNLSQRLQPIAAPALLHRFGLPDTEEDGGLLHRDLSRAAYNGLPSAQDQLALFRVAPIPPDAIRCWLSKKSSSIPSQLLLTSAEIAQLVKQTPLLFYLLCEAAVQREGVSLGLLGSKIVGEVIFAASAIPSEHDDPAVLEKVFGGNPPTTAAEFVRFATKE